MLLILLLLLMEAYMWAEAGPGRYLWKNLQKQAARAEQNKGTR